MLTKGLALFVAGLSLDSGRLQLVHLKMPFEMNIVVSGRKINLR